MSKTLNQIEGVSCNEVTGAFYALPKIELPRKAIETAKVISTGKISIIYFLTKTFSSSKVSVILTQYREQRIMGRYS